MTQPTALIRHLIYDDTVFAALAWFTLSFMATMGLLLDRGDIPLWGQYSAVSLVVLQSGLIAAVCLYLIPSHVRDSFGQSWGVVPDTPAIMLFTCWFCNLSIAVRWFLVAALIAVSFLLPVSLVLMMAGITELTLYQCVAFASLGAAFQGGLCTALVILMTISEHTWRSNIRSLRFS